jgi:hypothetical protein
VLGSVERLYALAAERAGDGVEIEPVFRAAAVDPARTEEYPWC